MKHLYLTTAITLLASPALADITPEELWESWQNTVTGLGVSLTVGQQERQGDVLVLQDVKTGIDMGFFVFEQNIETMRLEALGDGSVAVSYDSNLSGSGIMHLEGLPAPEVILSGWFEGTHGIVTGTADDYVYDFSIGLMQINGTTNMEAEGIQKSTSVSENMTRNLAGQMRYSKSESGLSMSYAFTVDSVENWQNVTTQIAGGEATVKQSQQTSAEGYDGEISVFVSSEALRGDSNNYFPEGVTMDARLGIEHFKVAVQMVSPAANVDIKVEQGPGVFALNISDDTIGFSSESQNVRMSVSTPQFGPAPFSVEVSEGGLSALLPLRVRDMPQDASFALRLEGVTVNDAVWAIADPANTLSHAPADFVIDTRASATLLLDWTDFEAAKALQGPAAILHSIKLQDFLIAFENARLTGVGVVEFNTDGHAPEPSGGMLNFNFDGVIALLEKLGSLPMVDPSLTAGAKGMLGAFTASRGGPDSLTAHIEFSEGGYVSINGQQVR